MAVGPPTGFRIIGGIRRHPQYAAAGVASILTTGKSVTASVSGEGSPDFGRVFYDDFESYSVGTLPTDNWSQTDFDMPQVVSSSADGVAGPHGGSRMMRMNTDTTLNSSNPSWFQSASKSIQSYYTSEVFVRLWMRLDQNHEFTDGSAKKYFRWFYATDPTVRDSFEVVIHYGGSGLKVESYWSDNYSPPNYNVNQLAVYAGDAGGDNTASTAAWHKIEWYINHANNGTFKLWHAGVLVINRTNIGFNSNKWGPWYTASNWEDGDGTGIGGTTNYCYMDDFEIYSDNGTGGYGSMSDASARVTP